MLSSPPPSPLAPASSSASSYIPWSFHIRKESDTDQVITSSSSPSLTTLSSVSGCNCWNVNCKCYKSNLQGIRKRKRLTVTVYKSCPGILLKNWHVYLALRHSSEHGVQGRSVVGDKPDFSHSAIRITLKMLEGN